jgi:hypothetical protein
MVPPPDIEAQILRYYHAEKWTVGTIARQVHVHHSEGSVANAGAGRAKRWKPQAQAAILKLPATKALCACMS